MTDRIGAGGPIAAVLLWCASAVGSVTIHEKGAWPGNWPSQLHSYRDRARTFDIGTTIQESVHEIRFETTAEFERVWPTILQLRSPGAPLRARRVEASRDRSGGLFTNDVPVVRIYTPVYGSSAQKPGGRMLPVGPPWPESIHLPDGSLPEYVAISEDGMRWVPALGEILNGFRHRARVDLEIVADGKILDFNRILVPPEIPVIDNRQAAEEQTGATRYVGPQGRPDNPGTADAPWDLASAFAGEQGIRPGDAIHLLEGVYCRRPNELFEVRLQGTRKKPIHVQPAPGHRVAIDGGLSIQKPSAHVWIRDLEILVSEPLPANPVSAGSHPADLQRPHGGLHMHGGADCKYINLVIHHCNQGISCWKDELNPEVYGCVIYANGWVGVDRGHGHCIYTQNDQGVKTISNCIMICPYEGSYTVHAYGSERAYVNNYLLTENICYERGPFLVGGGRPSQGIRVHRNVLYGIDMRIGYNAPHNEDCEIRDNLVVNGRLETTRYRTVTWEGNLVLPTGDTPRPSKNKSILLPNKYGQNRAHLAVFNWDGADAVEVETAGFLWEGDVAELFDPEKVLGTPVAEVECSKGAIRVPVHGEFAVFVIKARRR